LFAHTPIVVGLEEEKRRGKWKGRFEESESAFPCFFFISKRHACSQQFLNFFEPQNESLIHSPLAKMTETTSLLASEKAYTLKALLRKKQVEDVLQEIESEERPEKALKKTLSILDLLGYGIGCTIGAGIYSLIGVGALIAGSRFVKNFNYELFFFFLFFLQARHHFLSLLAPLLVPSLDWLILSLQPKFLWQVQLTPSPTPHLANSSLEGWMYPQLFLFLFWI
jgi:hypothetical protein